MHRKVASEELDLEKFGSQLDWRQFEGLAELAFRSFGFVTTKNYRIKKPRTEIDLLAVNNSGHAFAVDCKRWKRTVGQSTMMRVAERQITRCLSLLKEQDGQVEKVVPLILTLRDERLLVLENGVAIVPIQKVSDFLLNWDSAPYSVRTFVRTDVTGPLDHARNALVSRRRIAHSDDDEDSELT